MRKNRTFNETFRYLVVEKGAAPDNVSEHFGSRASADAACVFEGEVGHVEFLRLANQAMASHLTEAVFWPRQYFCADDELVRAGGGSYAFGTMAGATRTCRRP